MVVSAANSAARKRSRASSSAAQESRVPGPSADGVSEANGSEPRMGAGGRAAKAREELAAVPSQDGDLAVADELDADADPVGDELDGAVDLEDFDLDDDLAEGLGSDDLEIADTPDAEAETDPPEDTETERGRRRPRPRRRPPARRPRRARHRARATRKRSSSSATTTTTCRPRRWPWRALPPTRSRTT